MTPGSNLDTCNNLNSLWRSQLHNATYQESKILRLMVSVKMMLKHFIFYTGRTPVVGKCWLQKQNLNIVYKGPRDNATCHSNQSSGLKRILRKLLVEIHAKNIPARFLLSILTKWCKRRCCVNIKRDNAHCLTYPRHRAIRKSTVLIWAKTQLT